MSLASLAKNPTYMFRCMTTRRDNPGGSLWRLAVEGFNRILLDDATKVAASSQADLTVRRPARIRVWKEVADVYEFFLAGHCGRALSSSALSATMLKEDELLEMNILDILGDKILKSQIDAPLDVIPWKLKKLFLIYINRYFITKKIYLDISISKYT